MNLPILVYASGGSGGSILIWTIKKILWPHIIKDDPLCPLNSAHNQSHGRHWFGEVPVMEHCADIPYYHRVVHAEPLLATMAYSKIYPSVLVKTHDDQSLMEAAIMCKAKVPEWYHDKTLEYIMQSLRWLNSNLDFVDKPTTDHIVIEFPELYHGDLEPLLNRLHDWLGVEKNSSWHTILNIHNKWRCGNQRLLTSYKGNT